MAQTLRITEPGPLIESTLYPKITNHIQEVVKTLRWQHRDPENPEKEVVLEPIPIVGTVKLHGTHADILIYSDNQIVLQSRNKTHLQTTADNQGFAAAMSRKSHTLLSLRNRYQERWKQLNPNAKLDTSKPIIIAGEWIGEKIQKGVALVHLSKRLVIISAKINGEWVNDEQYGNIYDEPNGIYNISRAGFYHATLYPENQQQTIDELDKLAEAVAAKCPFAETFGLTGEGEGIVWKLVPYIDNADLWFKTKGGKFKPTFTPAPKKPAEGTSEKWEAAASVAKAWCSEQRLEQGWDVLREKGIERNMKGIGEFLKWVREDILVEEKGYIEENAVDESVLKVEITRIAKGWYVERYGKGD
ncbi:hypothetical protein K469DRAFT_714156 [Zopfia rhizophila CBS 207.26]|uniref:RNA ligase domain-containing protein n=1 Tax=Zopfia rhizophila CBS 207.26 TaxID=1314779 RepID=A0A6A6DPP4_9PEZI|nr:hypothetical protein K469DRAFT_714156 [Zopfia rhizophila CBS 207.26]